jgi:protein-S-isoprenylcysteine O-methyltransferase Ste14
VGADKVVLGHRDVRMKGQILLLGLGWLGQVLFWLKSLLGAGRGAAAPGEYFREMAVRFGMISLILLALILPSGRLFEYGRGAADACVGIFYFGQALAVWARLQLGQSWGIGVSPRAGSAASGKSGRYKGGIYGVVRHPIYLGTVLAIFVQTLLLQNAPSCLLLAGALAIVFLKTGEEGKRLDLPGYESPGRKEEP